MFRRICFEQGGLSIYTKTLSGAASPNKGFSFFHSNRPIELMITDSMYSFLLSSKYFFLDVIVWCDVMWCDVMVCVCAHVDEMKMLTYVYNLILYDVCHILNHSTNMSAHHITSHHITSHHIRTLHQNVTSNITMTIYISRGMCSNVLKFKQDREWQDKDKDKEWGWWSDKIEQSCGYHSGALIDFVMCYSCVVYFVLYCIVL